MELFIAYIASLWSNWLWPILQLLIGLGLVIFVHELGHFLLAKAVKIKVERFALGFGPRLWGFRRGETDYCVNLLPLGGYVKMLGQEDFKPLKAGEGDARAFNNKPVWARLAVVSAGVVMNVIFAAVLFVIVCLVGIPEPAPIIGAVVPGSPASLAEIAWSGEGPPAPTTKPSTTRASQASTEGGSAPALVARNEARRGLRPGDRIVTVDGDPIPHFQKLAVKAALARRDQVFTWVFEREIAGKTYTGVARVGVEEMPSEMGGMRLAFGIAPAADTVVADVSSNLPFQKGDRIVAIDGKEVPNIWAIEQIEESLQPRPATVSVLRNGQRQDLVMSPTLWGGNLEDAVITDGTRLYGRVLKDANRPNGDEVVLQLEDGTTRTFPRKDVSVTEDELLDILGMSPRIEVARVEEDSPAGKAGLGPGDVIANYADGGAPTMRKLYQLNEQFSSAPTSIVVVRGGTTLEPMSVTPKSRRNEPPKLGIGPCADSTSTVVAGVRPGSPAAKAGILPGDVIRRVNGNDVSTWLDVFRQLKDARGSEVRLSVLRNVEHMDVTIAGFGPDVFDPSKFKLRVFAGRVSFKTLETTMTKKNPLAAVAWGVGETWDFIIITYATLRGLAQRTVSTKEVVGPIGIGSIAIKIGRESFIRFIYLMAMLSVSLAVMNFLPIPVVDGGIVVFLLIEKIRGRPVPLKVMNVVQMAGLALLVLLFVALTWQDIARIIRDAW